LGDDENDHSCQQQTNSRGLTKAVESSPRALESIAGFALSAHLLGSA
jgi:hypothetical protein